MIPACCTACLYMIVLITPVAVATLHLPSPLAAALHLAPQQENDVGQQGRRTGSGVEVSAVPCKPRDTLVPLPLNASGETVFQPDVAVVRRCGGYCGIAVRCVPTKTRFVKRRVKEYNVFDKSSRIRTFKLEQHDACKCGCKVTASQCTPQQVFDPQRCRCVCRTPKQDCKPPHVWQPDTCSCTCSQGVENCSTGAVFDLEKCRCTVKRKKKGS